MSRCGLVLGGLVLLPLSCAIPFPVTEDGIDTSFARSGHVLRVRTGDWSVQVIREPEAAETLDGRVWEWVAWVERPQGDVVAFTQTLRERGGAQPKPPRWRTGILDLSTGERTYLVDGSSLQWLGNWAMDASSVGIGVSTGSPRTTNLTRGSELIGRSIFALANWSENGEWVVRQVSSQDSWDERVARADLPAGLIESDTGWIRCWYGAQGRWIFMTDMRFKGVIRWYDTYLVGASLETGEVVDIIRLPEDMRRLWYDANERRK